MIDVPDTASHRSGVIVLVAFIVDTAFAISFELIQTNIAYTAYAGTSIH